MSCVVCVWCVNSVLCTCGVYVCVSVRVCGTCVLGFVVRVGGCVREFVYVWGV